MLDESPTPSAQYNKEDYNDSSADANNHRTQNTEGITNTNVTISIQAPQPQYKHEEDDEDGDNDDDDSGGGGTLIVTLTVMIADKAAEMSLNWFQYMN